MPRDNVTHPPRDRAADERIAPEPAYVPPDGGSRTGGVGSGLAWLLGLGVLVAIGIAIWAWVDDDSAGPEVGATVNEISEDPGNWYGTTVTVSGEIDDFLLLGDNAATGTDRIGDGATTGDAGAADATGDTGGGQAQSGSRSGLAFTIGGNSLGEQVLVVHAGSAYQYLNEDSVVQVTGTVRQFDAASFNQAFNVGDGADGWFGRDWFADWDGRPAIVAQSIDPTVRATDAGN